MAGADLAFALELAELADSLSLPRFRALDLRVGRQAHVRVRPVRDAGLRERLAG